MLAGIDALLPGTAEAVRARIPAASLRAIDGTPGVLWLPFEHDHWLMDATVGVLGKDRAIDAWHRAMGEMFRRPVLRNFVDAAVRLFVNEPGQALAFLPRGWSLVYRDFCDPSFRRTGDRSAEIRFERIAPQVFDAEGYLHCWHAVCLGALDLSRPRDPTVEFELDRAGATAVATFRWA